MVIPAWRPEWWFLVVRINSCWRIAIFQSISEHTEFLNNPLSWVRCHSTRIDPRKMMLTSLRKIHELLANCCRIRQNISTEIFGKPIWKRKINHLKMTYLNMYLNYDYSAFWFPWINYCSMFIRFLLDPMEVQTFSKSLQKCVPEKKAQELWPSFGGKYTWSIGEKKNHEGSSFLMIFVHSTEGIVRKLFLIILSKNYPVI